MSTADLNEKRSKLSVAKQALLEKRLRGSTDDMLASLAIPRRSERDLIPLSFAQQRLWFLDQLQLGNPFYNVARNVRIDGTLDYTSLQRALSELVARHESLRTVFRVVGNEPIQVIKPVQELALPLPVIDLSDLAASDREKETARLGAELAETPFTLTKGPLLAARLLRLDSENHILFLSLHHIITDAWSTALLLRELVTLYEAFAAGRPSPLPELSIQYADFTLWQREFLKGETLDRQLSFWRQQLTDAPAMLELPLDRPRPPVQTFRGAFESVKLSENLSAALKDVSRSEGATLFMTLLAAFQTLLWRHTSQDDIVVGAPIANRTKKETESLIGFFVNTLVMRTQITPDLTFRELLRKVKETTLAAYSHQDLPFEKLVEELQPERSLSHNPLFQVTLALQNIPQAQALGQFVVDPMGVDGHTARLDLEAYFWDLPEGLTCEFVYSTDLFVRQTIQRLLQRFHILLEGLTSNPDCRISDLPMLTATERQLLLVEWNDHHREYPQDECVPALFEAQVERSPDAVAIVFGQERLTYAELNRKSNQVAHYLRARGVGPEARVGILMERSLEMVVGLLGILKAGGAYVPLDPAYPRERLSFMLEDAAAPVLLTQQQLVERLPADAAEVICLDHDWQQISNESAENPENNCTLQNLVYVIYTSGSTGKPKGVSVTHRSVVRLVKETDYAKFGPDEVFLQFAPLSFDASTFEIWGSLLNGARLVVMPPGLAALGELGEAVKRNGVTTLWLTAGLFHQIVETDLENLRGVRQLLAGGDVLSVPHLEKAADELRGCQLINGYGPTENTTFTCCYRVKSGERFESSVPIGFPISNTEVYILDRQTELAPIGVSGELYIGGDGLARGYLNRPDLTAERFIPNPFSSRAGERLYKTGDIARYQADGSIQFVGRLDHQVKLRGYRIELGEIETALREHSSVQDSVVVVRDSERGNKDLVAYVVAHPGEVADLREQLQSFLKKKLPGYMTPADFVFLERLPLTPNGKIDQRALPLPEKSRSDLANAFVAPRTQIEIKMASLWRDVLGREEIGVYDNFFDLGGHSLLATQVMSRIRENFEVNLPLRYFFEQPTVAGLAEFVLNGKKEDRESVPPIRRLPRGTVFPLPDATKDFQVGAKEASYPLSSMQQGMLLHSLYDRSGGAYIQQMVCELREPISVTLLTRAWLEAVERHAVLRTSFRWEGLAEPVQEVCREVELPFISEDWSDLTSEMQEQKIVLYKNADRRRGFELSEAPLMRVALFKSGERDYRMIWTFHHALLDGRSHFLVLKEVFEAYDAYHSGNAATPKHSGLYSEYIDWLTKQDLAKAKTFWRRALHGFRSPTGLRLPAPPQGAQGHSTQQVRLSPEITGQLRSLAQRNGFTLNNLEQAGWALLLSLYSGEDDVLFGATRACRHWTSDCPESMVGLYINTLPFRVQRSDRLLLEWLRELRAQHVALREYEHTPLMKIQGWSEVPRGTPLFDSVLVFENYQMNIRLRALGERWGARNFVLLEQTNYPLTLAAYASSDLLLKLEYDQQRFDAQSIERMLNHLQTVLAGIAANPDRRVRDVSLLTETGR